MNIEDKIVNLFREKGLGDVKRPVKPVSGGFMHRMYRVDTGGKSYAVKHLNPEIMKRPEAFDNFRKAEALEAVLEENGIPIVPALVIDGARMQEACGDRFYIFDWLDGRITDWDNITPAQCRKAGSIQGRIHAIDPRTAGKSGDFDRTDEAEPELCDIDWAEYVREAEEQGSEILPVLKENEGLLEYARDELNRARRALPAIDCITDEDMDPKNVMWQGDEPYVIDLECLDRGNPVSHVLQLSLQWSGITTLSLDLDKVRAFFEGYLEAYDNGFKDYASVFGVAYTWVEWLEYNITRALGKCMDENERQMGISEVRNTVARIKYIKELENSIKDVIKI